MIVHYLSQCPALLLFLSKVFVLSISLANGQKKGFRDGPDKKDRELIIVQGGRFHL